MTRQHSQSNDQQLAQQRGGEVDLEAEHDPAVSRRASNAGLQQEAGLIPHADKIQASFGPGHDVSSIRAHVGGDSAKQMGATAYATGNNVVFDRQPDLHTAAHEAAHVVQQARGINTYGGTGDHEKHADAVADRVVQGESAAEMLGGPSKGAMPAGNVVQFKKAPEDADAAERKEAHETARQGGYAAVSAQLIHVAKQMHEAAASIENTRIHRTDLPGGVSSQADEIMADYNRVKGGVERLWNGIPDLDAARKSQLHRDLAMVDGAYEKFKFSVSQAVNYTAEHNVPMGIRQDDIPQMLLTIHNKLGVDHISDLAANKDAPTPDKGHDFASDAIKANLDAALANAHAGRTASKTGGDQLKMDVRQTSMFVKNAKQELDAAGTGAKAHHGHVSQVVAEVEALETDVGSNDLLKDQYASLYAATKDLKKYAK
ncbi:MAG: 17 kDa surface antigen [Myxococcales bacterium]|nr:17 kDa surface antigen [Myxococcales bacterium]